MNETERMLADEIDRGHERDEEIARLRGAVQQAVEILSHFADDFASITYRAGQASKMLSAAQVAVSTLGKARRAEREAIKEAWDRLLESWPTGVVCDNDRHFWCLGCDSEQVLRLVPPEFPHKPDCRWLAMTAVIRAREGTT